MLTYSWYAVVRMEDDILEGRIACLCPYRRRYHLILIEVGAYYRRLEESIVVMTEARQISI